MFDLRHVTRVYRQGPNLISAVDGVDLGIRRGEYVAVTGPSGSGKSTLLSLLGGLDRPSGGQLYFEGSDLARLGDRALTRLRRDAFGFVFQQFNLIPTLTAIENVEATGAGRGAARQLLDEVGLLRRAHHLPSQLSGGEQQRVAIARALARNPKVILADEPTGNLDSRTAAEILELIALFSQRRGVTVVVVSHDSEATRHATRTIRMRDGRLLEEALVA
ncbi:MAG TPA: ABC transporter ATP-binding protein [Candidatus Dormibacteraeota bacterium]|nr:ABC transporter ATP-binding protein [Candidatus Dormibacteraeota bacterium]